MNTWLLPEHIEDLLPREAEQLERWRRTTLDTFRVHGYQLVMPPLLEYVESLLSGSGHDMDLKTFKLVDQLSGRMMGIRADTTPQAARIDAHLLNRQGVCRLCYAGSVLHTKPDGIAQSREPFQIGAELYGHKGVEADIEIAQLMIDVLKALGLPSLQLDLGHPDIFHALLANANIDAAFGESVFNAVEAKDVPTLSSLVGNNAALLALPTLYGDADVIKEAAKRLPPHPAITAALTQLQTVADHFIKQGVNVSVDLAELGGFAYERGMVFAAFSAGAPDAVARGGRYDEVGKVFGRARAATGFSLDLKVLLSLLADAPLSPGILAPNVDDASLKTTVAALRASGEIVITQLSEAHLAELDCDRELKLLAGQWQVVTR